MIHHMRSKVFSMIVVLGAATLIVASLVSRPAAQQRQEWPRFRGPGSNPIAENPKLPVSWSKTENVEWVADVPGVGWSSPRGTMMLLQQSDRDAIAMDALSSEGKSPQERMAMFADLLATVDAITQSLPA